MTVTLSPPMYLQFFDPNNTGAPLVGGKLFTYIAGTSTKQATWTDSAQITQNSNPIILDANGAANVWLDPTLIYKFVLAPANDTDPPVSALRSVDNVEGELTNRTLTQALLGAILYPRTTAEIALAVTPTNFFYPAAPYVDPRRYGASPAASDNQAALQTALNVALQDKSAVWIYGIYKTSPLSVTMTGSSTQPLRIMGSSVIGSGFQAVTGLSATNLLTFTNGNPPGVPINSFLVMENLSIVSTAVVSGVHGLAIKGLAFWRLSNVRITQFDRGLDVLYGLTAKCDQGCEFVQCNTGVKIAVDGSLSIGTSGTPNLLQFENCHISLNTVRGIEFNGGTSLQVIGCDIEGNGTAANATTGGIFILGQTSPDLQEGHVIIERCWFENNHGWSLNVAAQTNGTVNRLVIRSNEFIGAESGQNILVSGADCVLIEDQQSASVGDLYNITASRATIINCSVQAGYNLNVTNPISLNSSVAGVTSAGFGFQTQVTLTFTGTAAQTCLVYFYQQGPEVIAIFSDVQATSSAVTFTMTGLPAKFQPVSRWDLPAIVEDNGVDSVQTVVLQAASGTLTFTKGGLSTGFTAAGPKGVRRMSIRYRLDI